MEEERLGGIASAERALGSIHPCARREDDFRIWSDRRKTQRDVISAFYAKFKEESIRRERYEAPPSKETLRVWIHASRNSSNLRSRFGEVATRTMARR